MVSAGPIYICLYCTCNFTLRRINLALNIIQLRITVSIQTMYMIIDNKTAHSAVLWKSAALLSMIWYSLCDSYDVLPGSEHSYALLFSRLLTYTPTLLLTTAQPKLLNGSRAARVIHLRIVTCNDVDYDWIVWSIIKPRDMPNRNECYTVYSKKLWRIWQTKGILQDFYSTVYMVSQLPVAHQRRWGSRQ